MPLTSVFKDSTSYPRPWAAEVALIHILERTEKMPASTKSICTQQGKINSAHQQFRQKVNFRSSILKHHRLKQAEVICKDSSGANLRQGSLQVRLDRAHVTDR